MVRVSDADSRLARFIQTLRRDAGPWTRRLLSWAGWLALVCAVVVWTHERSPLVESELAYQLAAVGIGTVGVGMLALRGAVDGFWVWLRGRVGRRVPRPAPPSVPSGAVTAVALAAVVVLAGVAVPLGAVVVSEEASAKIIDNGGFESGDFSSWSVSGTEWSVKTDRPFEGTYSAYHNANGDADITQQIDAPSENFRTKLYRGTFSSNDRPSQYHFKMAYEDSGGNRAFGVDIRQNGDITVDNGTDEDYSANLPEQEWLTIQLVPHYSSNTWDLIIYDSSENVIFEKKGLDMRNAVSEQEAGTLRFNGVKKDFWIDNVETDGSFGPDYEINGTVTDADGSALEGASVTVTNSTGDTVGTNTTTATGAYSVGVDDGDYTVSVSADGYQGQTKDVSISGASETVDFSLFEAGTFEQEFALDDRTNGDQFAAYGPELTVAGPETTTTAFNHNDRAFVRVSDGEWYNLTVASDRAEWRYIGWVADESRLVGANPVVTLTMSGVGEEATATPTATESVTATPTLDERLQVALSEFELGNYSGTRVGFRAPPNASFDSVNYTIRDPSGDPVYNGSADLDGDRYYEEQLGNATNVSAGDGYTVEYGVGYEDGTTENGTTSWEPSQSSLTGGPLAPGGGGGGGGGTAQLVGYGLVTAGGAVALRRLGDGSVTAGVSAVAERARGLVGGR